MELNRLTVGDSLCGGDMEIGLTFPGEHGNSHEWVYITKDEFLALVRHGMSVFGIEPVAQLFRIGSNDYREALLPEEVEQEGVARNPERYTPLFALGKEAE